MCRWGKFEGGETGVDEEGDRDTIGGVCRRESVFQMM